MAAAARRVGGASAVDARPAAQGNAAPNRPGSGKKWSEVCESVQKPDGSVRTSPPFKNGIGGPKTYAAAVAASPQKGGGYLSGIGRLGASWGSGACSSLGGSSRGGSSGKSSRSSSRDVGARDGDISSHCSSGGWETSTVSSSGGSRPHTPPNVTSSPTISKILLMPDPIRTSLMLPPALLDDEQGAEMSRADVSESCGGSEGAELRKPSPKGFRSTTCEDSHGHISVSGEGELSGSAQNEVGDGLDIRPGEPLECDPFGRDSPKKRSRAEEVGESASEADSAPLLQPVPQAVSSGLSYDDEHSGSGLSGWSGGERIRNNFKDRQSAHVECDLRPGDPQECDPCDRHGFHWPERSRAVTSEWSPEGLLRYLKGVLVQVDDNLAKRCVPTAERLDAFISRLVANLQCQVKHAPKGRVRHVLQGLLSRRFQKFWSFSRNQKVGNRSTTPEELRATLTYLVDALSADGNFSRELVQAKPSRGGYPVYAGATRDQKTANRGTAARDTWPAARDTRSE